LRRSEAKVSSGAATAIDYSGEERARPTVVFERVVAALSGKGVAFSLAVNSRRDIRAFSEGTVP
jgi:hypothetical protein